MTSSSTGAVFSPSLAISAISSDGVTAGMANLQTADDCETEKA
jgi:hypothetical protein